MLCFSSVSPGKNLSGRIFIFPLVDSDIKKMKMMTGRWDLQFNVGIMFLTLVLTGFESVNINR
jgi:hypothetical protein